MTANERSGWRDEELSRRHRLWGRNVPVMDIDCVWAEYDQLQPVALNEFKKRDAPSSREQREVLVNLADRAGLPAFGVRYWPGTEWRFKVWPFNDHARQWLPGVEEMREADFVDLLYCIRHRVVPVDLPWYDRPFTEDHDNDPKPSET